MDKSYNLIAYQSLGSTNDEALRLAETSPDKTVILALEQTLARGRRGRTWDSPKGNLYCSLILKPDVSALACSQLGYVAALAIYDSVRELCPKEISITCKWPNDVLLNDKKVSGILLETSFNGADIPEWVVLGIGINLSSHPEDTPYRATSLQNEGAIVTSPEQALDCFTGYFDSWITQWKNQGYAPIRQTWLSRTTRLGQKILVRLENQELSGIFKGIDDTGALILHQDGEQKDRIITAGDIFFPDLTIGS